MRCRRLLVAAILGGLALACGKVGPPVRLRPEPPAAAQPEAPVTPSASDQDDSEERERDS